MNLPQTRKRSVHPTLRFYFLVVSTMLLMACNQTTVAPMNIVKTLQGPVLGEPAYLPDIVSFKGIPYAKPPVGELRWRAPQAAPRWQGTFDARQFAPSCSQLRHTSSFVWRREDFQVAEDCLYLNVWAPADFQTQNAPVMVWFHGGAHTSGQGHSKIFDGAQFASRGVVLVTINYRLGPLGFLAHPWLAEESAQQSAGNYGLLDKIAALNWVRDNISAFGGDANNITIFGQSAGSQSVCALLASPLAEGLFHKAIGQSAACLAPAGSTDENGYQRGAELVDATGADSLEALRKVPADDLLAAAESSQWANRSRITIDGWVLPEAPLTTFQAGRQHQVPLLVGSLANEGIHLLPLNEGLDQGELNNFISRLGGEPGAIEAAYASEIAVGPGAGQHAIATDMFMAYAMQRWARLQAQRQPQSYLYFMDHPTPAFHLYMPEQPQLSLPDGPRSTGAYHSGDLAYVFGNTNLVGLHWEAADHELSDLIQTYWVNFAKTGDPNGPGLPAWPAVTPETPHTLRLNSEPVAEPGIRRAKLAALAAALEARSE